MSLISDTCTISVIIPMYNASKTILRSIDSVLKQTYVGKLEIIVVNDGSTDDSLDVLTKYQENNDVRNLIVLNKDNGGVSSARNMGMKAAKGEYIALLDADDEWLPSKLERQMHILLNNDEIDFLGCNRNGEAFKRFYFKKLNNLVQINSRLLLYKNFFPTPTVIFKREILQKTGFFDESQRFAEEGNYWIRICADNTCALLNESHVVTGGGKPDFGHSGLSANLFEMEKGELKNIRLALKINVIGYLEFAALNLYSIVKYVRRMLIVKIR